MKNNSQKVLLECLGEIFILGTTHKRPNVIRVVRETHLLSVPLLEVIEKAEVPLEMWRDVS